MTERKRGAAARDRPAVRGTVRAVRAQGGAMQMNSGARAVNSGHSLVWLTDQIGFDSLECSGYTSLDKNPEVLTAVDTIARLVGAMTIHLMQHTNSGDIRVQNALSEIVDIRPNRYQTRSNFVRWIVRTLLLNGNGNAVSSRLRSRGSSEN